MGKWSSTAGPRMNKQVVEALRHLDFQKNGTKIVNGVQDGSTAEEAYNRDKTFRAITYNIFGVGGASNPKAVELYNEIAERYNWTITKENYKAILADLAVATKTAMDAIPYKDERRTPEAEKELRTLISDQNAKQEERDTARKAAWDAILAKKPSWAQAVIIAEYNIDTSDIQTDYFANRTDRLVVIGWRSGSREDFKQLRVAADRYLPGTNWEERRDTYSMGRGNYLSDHGWDGSGTGWVIKSRTPGGWLMSSGPVPEDGLPEWPGGSNGSVPNFNPENVQEVLDRNRVNNGFTIRPSSIGRDGVVEVVFPEKPDREIIDELKAAGFRWALRNACWYGPKARLPERYKVTA